MSNKLSNFNGGEISLNSIPMQIELASYTNRSCLFMGFPGLGKSAKIYEYARNNNYNLVVFTGGLLTKANIYGVDFINPDTKSCTHYVAEWYNNAINSDRKTVLFLDDFANANPQEMMILQQLLGDRKLGNYDLPVDKFIIVGATNRANDNANVFNISSPILSRLVVLEVQLNVDEYLEYSANNNHPSVHAFLKDRKWAITNDSKFLAANGGVPSEFVGYGANNNNYINPCPRTWSAVSDMLYKLTVNVLDDKYKEGFTQNVSGLIGSGLSSLFVRSLNSTLNIPSIEFLESTCMDKSVDYSKHITANLEAVSSVIFTVYQEINSRISTFIKLKDAGKIETKYNKKGKTTYVYSPISNLIQVLDKIAHTNFKDGINSKATISNVFDMLMANSKVNVYYQLIEECEPIINEHVVVKSTIDMSLRNNNV
jgi:hypothetical protein